MPQVSLFGEQSLTLVAATFSDQATAAEAASELRANMPQPVGCRGSSEESGAVGLGG